MASSSAPGLGARRIEDPALVSGSARYVGDLAIEGMLCVAFVRSPLAHARVKSLDLARARAMPGVVAAFGPDDLEALRKPMRPMSREHGVVQRCPSPLTAEPRFDGDPVAVIVAEDAYRAADAVEAVGVDYEPLPVVVDVDDALREGAPLVHADVPGNVMARLSFRKGDVDEVFAQADVVVRDRFLMRRVSNASLEPRGVAAKPGGCSDEVKVTVWSSTQTSSVVRATLSGALDLPPEAVHVIVPCVGGGFGAKGRSYPEEIAVAALALHLQRPCRWEATRAEDLRSTSQGHASTVEAELAATRDGDVLAVRGTIWQDGGAYMWAPLRPPQYAAQHMLGPYRVRAADVEIVAAYTNLPSITPIRGGGREQGVFALERLMDHLAREIGRDPLEVRERNLLRPEDMPYDTGYPRPGGGNVVYDSSDFPAYLREARRLIGYDEVRRNQAHEPRPGHRTGIGVTLYVESTAMGAEGARVRVNDDGTVHLALGSPDTGQSHHTTMAQLVSSELGVPLERIHVVSGDTREMPVGTGTFASRFAVMSGNATALAARQVRQRALVVAAFLLDVTPEMLDIRDGVVCPRRGDGGSKQLAEIVQDARRSGIALDVTHVFAPRTAVTYCGGAGAAVVDLDLETGCVTLERFVAVHDAGRVLNPVVVRGQYQGAITMGLGQALLERIVYDAGGRLLTTGLGTYAIPRSVDTIRFEVKERSCRSGNNPEGIKGIGESGVICTLPTIAAAVEDALAPLDVRINELPILPEAIALHSAALTGHGGVKEEPWQDLRKSA